MRVQRKIVIIFFLMLSLGLPACFDSSDGDSATPVLKISYAAGEGNTTGIVPDDSTDYQPGDEVTVLGNTGNLAGAAIRDGIKQRFVEWNTSSNGTGTSYLPGDTFNIAENITLHAIYTTGTEVIRKVGPGGGWVFYDAGSVQSWGRYLEAAREDQSASIRWFNIAGGIIVAIEAIGTGYENTNTIIADQGTSYAAGKARACTDGGYNNWSLPSRAEPDAMYSVLDAHGIGDFADSYYWSSSTFSISELSAISRHFGNGNTVGNPKNNYLRVRAVRAF